MDGKKLEYYITRYRESVFAAALFYTKSPSDADDIVQDVFFRLYTYNGAFESDEHVKAWLIRCAINRCKNLLKSPWYRLSAPLEAAAEKISPETDELCMEIFPLLKKLGRNNRVTMYLYYYEGYSTEQIAKLLGISVIAVTSRLKRGRQQLKKLLTDGRRTENEELV